MARLPESLRDAGCRKPHCRTASDNLHRHHKRHQAMWRGIWASRRGDEPEFQEFIKNYDAFHEEDIVWICDKHHAEIHAIYDSIIESHRRRTGKPLYKYTWAEANDLMDKLEEACVIWLAEPSSGSSFSAVAKQRKKAKRKRKQEGA